MNALKAERLLREMRERAIVMQNDPTLDLKTYDRLRIKIERQKQLDAREEERKLYFNAGRWAGGARDHVAREAFERVNAMA